MASDSLDGMHIERLPRDRGSAPAAYLALATMSLASAGIHFVVIPEHLEEFAAFGIFFAIVAWCQALWAVGLPIEPSRWMLLAGTMGNIVVALIWVVSRTAGLPFGPDPGVPEAVSTIDVVSTVLEVVIAAGCVALLLRPRWFTAWDGAKAFVALIGFVVAVALITTVAIAASPKEHGTEPDAGHVHGTQEGPGGSMHEGQPAAP